jgi:hypothetical protein
LAPIMLGTAILALAIGFADHAAALFVVIPIGAVGALLVLAGADLAISRRLFDGKPSCWWVIGVTALVTVISNPVLGWFSEFIRAARIRSAVLAQTAVPSSPATTSAPVSGFLECEELGNPRHTCRVFLSDFK